MTAAEFSEIRAFLAVADERNFRRAATRLKISPSALSRTIRTLEERLGVRLLTRTTRSVALTEAGQSLQTQIQPLIAGMDEAVRQVGAFQESAKGTVRINLPRVAATVAIMPKLAGFLSAYPDVRLDLVIDNDMTDVVAQGFDAGIRAGHRIGQDMVAIRLTPDFRMAVVGTPSYFNEHTPPASPHELAGHRTLTYKWEKSGTAFPWSFEGPQGRVSVAVEDVLTLNDTDLLLSAALRGIGIAFLAETVVRPYLAIGDLVRVLEEWCEPVPGFHLYYPNRANMPAALRAFVDYMKLSGR
ncbi:LysR family transcriptional regulator [Skermanella stibiiresistens]|nr:LysR family transcriptional regulator [Skermanella stibiiresistens]